MTDREIMQMALEALEWSLAGEPLGTLERDAAAALRKRLAQPEREWKGLTKDEMRILADWHLVNQPESYEMSGVFDLIRAVAEKLEEKND